jgi:hypothetical protein
MELTEMQQFAMDLLKKKGGKLNTSYLSHEWAMYKRHRISAASRDRFGTTSAAYRTLRRLVVLDLVEPGDDYSTFHLKNPL